MRHVLRALPALWEAAGSAAQAALARRSPTPCSRSASAARGTCLARSCAGIPRRRGSALERSLGLVLSGAASKLLPGLLLLIVVALAGACRSRVPTYHEDVAPIFARHCRGCHREGGIAPVPTLADYASARMYAQPIRLAVQTRRMPPWGVDDTGLCNHWQGSRWLSTDEIATISRWQESGSPEGKPQPSPPAPVVDTPFRADATVDIGGVYRPGLGAGGYHCFVADPQLDRDRLLSAIRVVSNDPRAVAQVTLFALDSAKGEAEAGALDAQDPTLGYSCYGTARVRDARLVASWTWPDPVLRLPAGVRLHAGRKLIVQIHYDITAAGGAFETATRMDLELDDHAREARLLAVAASGSLAPGQRYVSVENRQIVERRLRVVGIAPRMHIRGDVMKLTVEHGAQASCLATFDHWHFYNQQLFRPASPIDLQPGDRIAISCAFNTQGRVQPVGFGEGADQEECVAYVFVTE